MFINSTEFTRSELTQLFGLGNCFSLPDMCKGVTTDTRTLGVGNLFVALQGERFDGHDHIQSAYEKGATCVIVRKGFSIDESVPHIVVDDTLFALGELARVHRKRFTIPVIAIAGAAGKTSTKELVAFCVGKKYNVLKTEANYNNRVGVPLTLLQLTENYSAAVIEIGTNEPGEIERLSEILQPTVGVITNIGKEHLEKLKDLDGVEKEETALFRFLHNSGGKCIINLDDERLRTYVQDGDITYSVGEKAHVSSLYTYDDNLKPIISLSIESETISFEMNTIGITSIMNATATAAIAYAHGFLTSEIASALAEYKPEVPHGYARMIVQHIKGITVLNDCYNANPESVSLALRTMSEYPSKGKRIAVLADMLELGDSAVNEHSRILEYALQISDYVILFGEIFVELGSVLASEKIRTALCHERIVEYLNECLREGDVMLIKGSRGMRLEKVLELWNIIP